MGDWFQDFQIPKSMDAQVPYIQSAHSLGRFHIHGLKTQGYGGLAIYP